MLLSVRGLVRRSSRIVLSGKKNSYTVTREYVDEAESGRVADRPQFRKMIEEGGRQYPVDALVEFRLAHEASPQRRVPRMTGSRNDPMAASWAASSPLIPPGAEDQAVMPHHPGCRATSRRRRYLP